MKKITQSPRVRRSRRVRARIRGTSERPRLSVFRSNQHFYAQLIDDVARVTLLAVSDHALGKKEKGAVHHVKVDDARALGMMMAKKATEKGVTAVVFDRGPYRYHGRVEAFAAGAREGGLQF